MVEQVVRLILAIQWRAMVLTQQFWRLAGRVALGIPHQAARQERALVELLEEQLQPAEIFLVQVLPRTPQGRVEEHLSAEQARRLRLVLVVQVQDLPAVPAAELEVLLKLLLVVG
jgi:hypothetical protein